MPGPCCKHERSACQRTVTRVGAFLGRIGSAGWVFGVISQPIGGPQFQTRNSGQFRVQTASRCDWASCHSRGPARSPKPAWAAAETGNVGAALASGAAIGRGHPFRYHSARRVTISPAALWLVGNRRSDTLGAIATEHPLDFKKRPLVSFRQTQGLCKLRREGLLNAYIQAPKKGLSSGGVPVH